MVQAVPSDYTCTHVRFLIHPSLPNPLTKSITLEQCEKPVLLPKNVPSVMDGKTFEQPTCLRHHWDEFVELELCRTCLF